MSPRDRSDEFDRRLDEKIERDMLAMLEPKPRFPEGIVSIVFTDVVESTAMIHRLGETAARELLRRHDDVVRATLARHGGIEVERDGDGFVLAFTLASRAVRFGASIHGALAEATAGEEEIRLRVGIDTGEVMAEEKGYFGRTVIRASRIEGHAAPGTTLVSETTKLIAECASVEAVRLEPAGTFEFKGIPGEHALFQVLLAD